MTRRPPSPRRPAVAVLARLRARARRVRAPRTTPPARRSTQPLTLVLDYFPNADHAGIYAAQERGEFAQAGLDVQIVTPSDPAAPLKLLAAGRADIAISYEPELLLARDKGLKVVTVGALVQRR